MASPPVSYFAWLRFQRAVGRWARLALGLDADEQRSVIWADHNVQRPPLPYLSLQVTSGPSRRAQDAEQWPRLEPLTMAVQVLPSAVVAAGDACRFFVNGELFEHLAAPGDTVTTVRNAQLARVQASVQLGATATSSGADLIVLAADRPGSLRAEAAVGCAATVTTTQLVSMVVGPREIRVRATAYGAPEPRTSSDVSVAEWVELLTAAAQDSDLRLFLTRQRVTFARVQVMQQRPSGPSGPEREPRAAADLLFGVEVRRGTVVVGWLGEVVADPPIVVN